MTESKHLSEFEIIRRYFQNLANSQGPMASVIRGVGDDCAILSVPNGYELVVSMDTLVVDRHFPKNLAADEIAQRAFCVCLSDLAAMGAQPAWFTLGLTLPEADPNWLDAFCSALLAIADDYQCTLVGGDTTQGPLVITLQVHGFVKCGAALTRDGARVGDDLCVTGSLGDGRAALSLLTQSDCVGVNHANYLRQRFIRPEPQIKAGRLLAGKGHAAIDISDGLLADLDHLVQASQVDVEVYLDAIPISRACRELAGPEAITFALTGGDDYQLAFTLPKNQIGLLSEMNRVGINASIIGNVVSRKSPTPQVYCIQNDRRFLWPSVKGYQHFAS